MPGIAVMRALLLSAMLVGRLDAAEPVDAVPVPPEACVALLALDFAEALGVPVQLTGAATQAATVDGSPPIPETCRVTGRIDSTVGFDLHLPVLDWDSTLLVIECPDTCGEPERSAVAEALGRGYAALTVDPPTDAAMENATRLALEVVAGYFGEGHVDVRISTRLQLPADPVESESP